MDRLEYEILMQRELSTVNAVPLKGRPTSIQPCDNHGNRAQVTKAEDANSAQNNPGPHSHRLFLNMDNISI